jgi:hypothetical protein
MKIRAEARRFKEPLPKRMQEKPDLFFGNALFLNAWFDLDQERKRPEKITRSMCFQYAIDYDLSEEQTEDLWYHIRIMDSEFLPWWQKKQPKPKAPKGRRGKP